MWAAAAPLPYYSAYRTSRRKGSSTGNANTRHHGSLSSSSSSAPVPAPGDPKTQSKSISDMLEPSVEGPPSPQRIRALSKQMKAASSLENKNHGHSPSSGSFRSFTSDRPSWDQALESISLSRRSSGRSTASSMPSRERPDSVQLFGKSIFGRKAKLKRESSLHSSSGSSLHSADTSVDATSSLQPREHGNRTLFRRRRSVKGDGPTDNTNMPGNKLSISGPYNFQHVTHTRRDHLQNLQRASRMELVTEFSTLKTIPLSAANGHLKGIHADDLHFSDFSAHHIDAHEAAPTLRPCDGKADSWTRSRSDGTSFPARQGQTRRLVKASKSQENLRTPPPRPRRPSPSPLEPLYSRQVGPAPPIPPPRLSSRQSIRYDGFDPLGTMPLERPQTSGGFRHPSHFRFGSLSPEPPATSHGFVPRSELENEDESPFPHAVTTPDDEAWPLGVGLDAPLPDVPEEEEHYTLARPSRASLISNNSSLRGSQSVPLLRQVAQNQAAGESQGRSQGGNRPPSSGSDTLGTFDLFAAQRALKAAARADSMATENLRDNWEDDIDYCYEHEAEADCYYEWTRPSFDTGREHETTPLYLAGRSRLGVRLSVGARNEDSTVLLTPGPFDVPALSPASQVSVNDTEAVTPTAAAIPVTSNFSLPRTDASYRVQRARADSHASSFKESHGFHLSPTLLIPTDFQQQMLLSEAHLQPRDDGDVMFLDHFSGFDSADSAEPEPTSAADRNSTSTAGTELSSHTTSSGERHASATSNSTAFTKFTMNSASVEELGNWGPKTDSTTPTMPTMPPSPLAELIPRRPDGDAFATHDGMASITAPPGQSSASWSFTRANTSLGTPPTSSC